jgi:hypothetical protein
VSNFTQKGAQTMQTKKNTIRQLCSAEIIYVVGNGCCFIIEQDQTQLRTKPACSSVVPGIKKTLPNTDDGRMECDDICNSMKKSCWESYCCGSVFFTHDCKFISEEEFKKVMH